MTQWIDFLSWSFGNPMWLASVIIILLVGWKRVNNERRSFNTKIWGMSREMKQFFLYASGFGLLGSLIYVLGGLVVTIPFLVIYTTLSLLFLLIGQWLFLTPFMLSSLSLFVLWLLQRSDIQSLPIIGNIDEMLFTPELIASVFILSAILTFFEGVILKRYGQNPATVQKVQSKRGGVIARFERKQLWLLPGLLIIPGSWIEQIEPYWPIFQLEDNSFAFLLFPFIVGFHKKFYSNYGEWVLQQYGKTLQWLSVVGIVLGSLAFFDPIYSLILFPIFAFIRIYFIVRLSMKDDINFAIAQPVNDGLFIVGIVEDSPASKLGLQAGEVIEKVNSEQVRDTKTLYEALQKNAAHCKLQVRTRENELKFVQTVVYEQDNFKLGLICIEK